MKKLKILIYIFFLIIVLCIVRDRFIIKESSYSLEFESLDNRIVYQIFYLTKEDSGYSEEKSILCQTLGNSSEFIKYTIEIPTEEEITALRIDFGEYPNKFSIKNLKIIGESSENINYTDIIEGFNSNIDSYKLKDNLLEINSTQIDIQVQK